MKIHFKIVTAVIILFIVISDMKVLAEVRLPSILSHGAILQQRAKVQLWGWCDPGEQIKVTISWLPKSLFIKGNRLGQFSLMVNTPQASLRTHSMEFSGRNTIVLDGILIGEVWFCSGQSNMQFTFAKGPLSWESGVFNYEQKIERINNPYIRQFTVKQNLSDTIMPNAHGGWSEAKTENMKLFSAVGFSFAEELFKKTGYPIALINSTWGGTNAEAWVSRSTIENTSGLNNILSRYEIGIKNYNEDTSRYLKNLKLWQIQYNKARAGQSTIPLPPIRPIGLNDPRAPNLIYNAMVAPLVKYKVKGVIWYQGENNADHSDEYQKLFTGLIDSWRKDRKTKDLPFYFVQISTHYSQPPELRNAQLLTFKSVKNTGMVVSVDVGDSLNIHPRNKETIGKRLSLWALNKCYGYRHIIPSGPIFKKYTVDSNSLTLYFDYAKKGLILPKERLSGFEIAGVDNHYFPADAVLSGKTVILKSKLVPIPAAARLGWRTCPKIELLNSDGLPASPFKTND